MAGDNELKSMVDEMERMLRDLRAAQAAARRRTVIGSLVLLVVVVGFAVAGYLRLRENFSQDKLQAAATIRMQLLAPQLEAPLNATLKEVVPYYLDMGRDRLQRMAPKFDARVQEEADKLGKDLEVQLNAQLDAFFAKLSKNTAAELSKSFPAMMADGGVAASKKLNDTLALEAAKLEADGKTLYETKAQEIRSTLAKFAVPDVKQTNMDTLNRQLLHDLLMLADHEMTGQAKDAATNSMEARK